VRPVRGRDERGVEGIRHRCHISGGDRHGIDDRKSAKVVKDRLSDLEVESV
jgi:hypothetical protein